MFKMKLMTLLKNPKARISLIVLTAIIIMASIIALPTKADNQINVAFRAASMNVSAGSKDILMPEVGPGQNDQETKAKKYNNVYCIDEGTTLSYAAYTQEKNLYNASESKIYFKNYNSALWLIDNMYISTASNKEVALDHLANLVTSPDVKKNVTAYGDISSDKIKSLNKTVGNGKDSSGNKINRNLIEVIEQLVMWNYTNNASSSNFDKLVNAGFSGSGITNDDQNACKYLYHSLKYLAGKQTSYTSNGTTEKVISLEKSNAKIDIAKNRVGPYALKQNGININLDNGYKSKISAKVTKTDGTTQNLGSDKVKVEKDGSFYIDITGCANVKKVDLTVAAIYSGAKTTAQVIVNGQNQNLLNIKKEVKSNGFSDSKDISYSGKYTIKLIKVKKDGTTVITKNPAKFTVSGSVNKDKAPTDQNGILSIAENKKIESASSTDTYKIVEDEAPKGYKKYDGEINVTVKFKQEGTNFILDESATKAVGTGKNGTVRAKIQKSVIEIYVPNDEDEKSEFDLSLRKFITKIDDKAVTISREPKIDETSKKVLDVYKTAAYHHTKQSLKVNIGSKVEYTLRIYNEGKKDGYAKQITDYLPEKLKFVKLADESSKEYKATTDPANSKKVIIEYTGNSVIKANSIDRILKGEKDSIYQEVKLICEVEDGAKGYLTNRAEITNYGYDDNGTWKEAKAIGNSDRDSVQNTISDSLNLDKWYENAKTYSYTDSTGKMVNIDDYYPGVQDDDDFETVEVKEITGEYKLLIKKVDSSNKNQGLEGAYFAIGKGLVTKVGPTDKNGMVEVFKSQKITPEVNNRTISIKEITAPEGYEKYDQEIELKIATKQSGDKYVIDTENTKLVNDKDKKVTLDVDDKESVITITIENDKKEFDLALRKFITKLNDKDITNRVPNVDVTELKAGTVTTAKYDHTKDPVDVCKNDIVTYTLRVYNEGGLSGYATKVMDDVPDGLEFLPENSVNKEHKWKMYTESTEDAADSIKYAGKTYVPTTDATKADVIVTDYLKDSLIKGFDPNTMETLDYKDIKVAFKVVEPNTSDRIIINYAQITDDADFNKNTVTDRDSVPNEWNEGEDDQDIEKIKLRYFDLALRKWVTEAIVTENGQTQVTPTGHQAEDNPEEIVKVDLKKSKLDQVTVKFRYSIRVTNEGEIAGYAKEISDYIPNGLRFIAEENPEWTEKDGKVVTNALANTLLQPGESAEVSILLTWINDANNMGVMINTAEISEDYNEYGTPDKDSTPNNKVPGEDDIDDAPVMLTVKTGSEVLLYVTLGFVVLSVIGLGVFGVKRYVK